MFFNSYFIFGLKILLGNTMNILIAIGGRKYSKPTLDLGMKVSNSFEASTTIAYVGKKISQFSEKDVSIVHQNLDERQLYRPGVRTLEWAYNFLKSNQNTNVIFGDLNTDNSEVNLKSSDPLCILIGPEGDFTVKEREIILKLKNVIPLKINENILRSETAAISMISIISFNLLS